MKVTGDSIAGAHTISNTAPFVSTGTLTIISTADAISEYDGIIIKYIYPIPKYSKTSFNNV